MRSITIACKKTAIIHQIKSKYYLESNFFLKIVPIGAINPKKLDTRIEKEYYDTLFYHSFLKSFEFYFTTILLTGLVDIVPSPK